ncbi:hypothetical protein QBC45DRAFT_11011 [Copromyces sp. CBS 386.78]|nr:hypothetical protein QBC45DRAFT_11011 [Copromyces sp. CBS 386.78]
MAASFHRFLDFPWEIRARIWEHTVEPRTVEVRIPGYAKPVTDEMRKKYNLEPFGFPWITVQHLRSSTPVPAPLHACREARNHLTTTKGSGGGLGSGDYYQKAFQCMPAATWDGRTKPLVHVLRRPDFWLELGLDLNLEEPRYVWMNFEMDMLSIGPTRLDQFLLFYEDITRLKLERARDERFIFGESSVFYHCVHLQEVHIVCTDGLDNWAFLVEDDFCQRTKNILLIDGKTGETARPADLAAKWDLDELRAVEYRKNGARINPDTDVPFVPWLPPGWLEGEEYFCGEYYYESGEEAWEYWDDDC